MQNIKLKKVILRLPERERLSGISGKTDTTTAFPYFFVLWPRSFIPSMIAGTSAVIGWLNRQRSLAEMRRYGYGVTTNVL